MPPVSSSGDEVRWGCDDGGVCGWGMGSRPPRVASGVLRAGNCFPAADGVVHAPGSGALETMVQIHADIAAQWMKRTPRPDCTASCHPLT